MGINPIPNLQQRIDTLMHRYGADNTDIIDVEYEPADIEEEALFGKENMDD